MKPGVDLGLGSVAPETANGGDGSSMKGGAAIAGGSLLRWSPVLVLGFFVLYPLGMLVFGAFWSAARITQPGHLTFAVIANVRQDPAVHQVIWNTVIVSLGATVISVVIVA